MFCQNCGKQLYDEAVMCPACGTETVNAQKANEKSKKKTAKGLWKLIVGIILLFKGFINLLGGHIGALIYILVGLALVVWWINKHWEPKK